MNTEFLRTRFRSQEGSLIVIVMMFVLVFMALGTALFFLVQSSNRGVQTERKDVKAFNVAEAGIDAGLAALSLSSNWPRFPTDPTVTVVASDVLGSLSVPSQPPPNPFSIQVEVYDDTASPENPRTVVDKRDKWDKNGNDKMWIDSSANMNSARHRIIVLAQRQPVGVGIPDFALLAGSAGGNGQGLYVGVDPLYRTAREELNLPIGPLPYGTVGAYYTEQIEDPPFDKLSDAVNVDEVSMEPQPAAFSSRCPSALTDLLKSMAMAPDRLTFYNDENGGADAAEERLSDQLLGPGSIIYLETSADPVVIAGNAPMGTREKPIILVIDTMGTGNGIDWRGTEPFYGVVIVLGDVELRGTMSIYGSVLSNGAVKSDGGPGILYNGDVIRQLNRQYTMTAVMVPNTWEEFTVAQ